MDPLFKKMLAASATHLRRSAAAVALRSSGAASVASSLCSSISPSRRCWATTLVLSDPCDGGGDAVPPATCSAVEAAKKLQNGNDLALLVVGGSAPPTSAPAGVAKIYHVPLDAVATPETVAKAVKFVVGSSPDGVDVVMGTSTKFGSTVIPRAAALLNSSPVTDVVKIESSGTCEVVIEAILFEEAF